MQQAPPPQPGYTYDPNQPSYAQPVYATAVPVAQPPVVLMQQPPPPPPADKSSNMCGAVIAAVALGLYILFTIVALATPVVTFDSPHVVSFNGRMTHFKFSLEYTAGVEFTVGISDWDRVRPLKKMEGGVRASAAFLIIGLFIAIFLFVVQCLRFCRMAKYHVVLTHSTAVASVFLFMFQIAINIAINASVAGHMSELLHWIIKDAGLISCASHTGASYYVLYFICDPAAILIFALGIRTWAQEKCCCDCCTCSLAPDEPRVNPATGQQTNPV